MQNVIFIIGSDDIETAERLARTLDDYRTFVFDPVLVDTVRASELVNIELMSWERPADYPELVKAAHARAHAFEAQLDPLAAATGLDCSLVGWQHLNLYYFFLTHAWYSQLWADMLPRLGDIHPHIFVCNNPSTFYWPSFLPSLLLLQYLRTDGIAFSAYPYGDRPDETDAIPGLCSPFEAASPCDILVHVPTCFYDAPYFNDELKASGRTVGRIVSKYWDVNIEAPAPILLQRTVPQHPGVPEPLWERAQQFSSTLNDALVPLLQPYIASHTFCDMQARHLANIYRSQFLTYFLLRAHFAEALPKKLLLSDHDAGFHGPLIAFAEKHRIPVLMVPHAKMSDDTEFAYEGLVSLTHPMQGIAVRGPGGKNVASRELHYPAALSMSTAAGTGLKRIGLLLNGFSLNGIWCTGWDAYIAGIEQIVAWCRAQDIELRVRCRPGQSLFHLLEQNAGLARAELEKNLSGTLLQFAEGLDVCLMYDAPTTASLDLLRMAVPVLNPIAAPLTRAEAATARPEIIAACSVSAVLAQLDTFAADPANLRQFRIKQFASYVDLFRQGSLLRELI